MMNRSAPTAKALMACKVTATTTAPYPAVAWKSTPDSCNENSTAARKRAFSRELAWSEINNGTRWRQGDGKALARYDCVSCGDRRDCMFGALEPRAVSPGPQARLQRRSQLGRPRRWPPALARHCL